MNVGVVGRHHQDCDERLKQTDDTAMARFENGHGDISEHYGPITELSRVTGGGLAWFYTCNLSPPLKLLILSTLECVKGI